MGLKLTVKKLQAKGLSERRSCLILQVGRSGIRYAPKAKSKTEQLVLHEIRTLAKRHKRFGTPRLTAMLRNSGLKVNHKRVERLYRKLGLTLARRRPKRKRKQPTERMSVEAGSRNHVWSYDFVHDLTEYGEKLKLLVVVDEHTRECLEIRSAGNTG